jgi:hypothetical protein
VSVALALGALLGSCASIEQAKKFVQDRIAASKKKDMLSKQGQQITIEELGQLMQGFADRYMTLIRGACEQIERENTDELQRRVAHGIKLHQVSSVYDIVTNADAYTQLLDLTLVVTLQSMKWIDEDQADAVFGERGRPLIAASRKTREDIWNIASRVLKPEQLETLDYLIWVSYVSWIRFDDFAGSRGKSAIAEVPKGTGLLAPVGEAKQAVDEVRLLGERVFYLSKRMPVMLDWQIQSAMDNVLYDPKIDNITSSVTNVSKTVEQLPQTIAKERAALFDGIQGKEGMINNVFGQYRVALADTNKLTGSVMNVADSANQLMGTLKETTLVLNSTLDTYGRVFPKDPNAKPFEIEEYTKTLLALTTALKEANQLINTTGDLLGSPKLQQPLAQINAATTQQLDNVTSRSARILDQAFWRGVALIIVFFILLTIYRLLVTRVFGVPTIAVQNASSNAGTGFSFFKKRKP